MGSYTNVVLRAKQINSYDSHPCAFRQFLHQGTEDDSRALAASLLCPSTLSATADPRLHIGGVAVLAAELRGAVNATRDPYGRVVMPVAARGAADPLLAHGGSLVMPASLRGVAGAVAAVVGVAVVPVSFRAAADALLRYRIVAEQDDGDQSTSNTVAASVETTPEPPSDLSYTWDAQAKKLTLSWQASRSADVVSYPVRCSAGDVELALDTAPVQDTAQTTYERTFTTESGLYVFSVQAKDAGGKESLSLGTMLSLRFQDGRLLATPAEPDLVRAGRVPGGGTERSWLYRPWQEVNGPGGGYEARIYWNGGGAEGGPADFISPLDIVLILCPMAETRSSYLADGLTPGCEYRFAVRIASAAHPAGTGTPNTAPVAAVAPDPSFPAPPTITCAKVS